MGQIILHTSTCYCSLSLINREWHACKLNIFQLKFNECLKGFYRISSNEEYM